MLAAIGAILVASLLAPLAHRLAGRRVGWLLALVPLGAFAFFLAQAGRVAAGEVLTEAYPWAPSLGLALSLRLDGLGLLFALIICGIGALILIYAGGYLAGDADLGRLCAFLLLFMASMLGIVLADNLLLLFVFWELTSISSYLLIGFRHTDAEARGAALQALLVTGGGGLALLAGLVLMGGAGGSFELSVLLAGGGLQAHPLYLPALACVLLGAFAKSAQLPFHFWLPAAMAAPTPVSAYLHSATMVKAGVYLLARLSPLLGGTPAWAGVVGGVGAATMLVGGGLALFQSDMKRLLAYSTVSALGTMTLLIGVGGEAAITAMVVFLLAHALYKGALFMVAGAIDHEAGTRDATRLGGLWRAMPITAATAGLAALALAGAGPLLSFIGKELIFEAALELPRFGLAIAAAVALAGALFTTVALIVGLRPFFGTARPTPQQPHEAPPGMWLGPALLALGGLALGLLPGSVQGLLVAPAVGAVVGEPATVELSLWHGLNPALGLSALSLAAGVGLYLGWERLRGLAPLVERAGVWGPSGWYEAALAGLNAFARWQTRLLQNGYLRLYLLTIVLATAALTGWALLAGNTLAWPAIAGELRFYEVGIALLLLGAAGVAVRSPGRLSTVAALGVVGYGVALIYIIYGAPDLAMTQMLVETLQVLLFVLVFYHLPRFQTRRHPVARAITGLAAVLFGALMTALILAVTATPPESALAPFFLAESKPAAHGSNVVNVILVDFRGLDTLGEITVLAVAAIGVYALLRLRLGREDPS
ncbi:MAG: putative monovalent cation/H+ antiporter subunit A [Chloroflexales bacterium]|nr:putative monovalent cation/H+ antiporter subunit A [Chloroflexales bacterium]